MNNLNKISNFLKNHDHLYIGDILIRFIIIEDNRKNNPERYNVSELKLIEKETGLNALDLDKLVKYYKILNDKGSLSKIVGQGNNIDEQIEQAAEYAYIMNTHNFMVFINENTPMEQLDNAIWDPSYDPMVGFRR